MRRNLGLLSAFSLLAGFEGLAPRTESTARVRTGRGKCPADQMTRQRIRQDLRKREFEPYRSDGKSVPQLPRKERRRLARAFAIGAWREMQAKARGEAA